MTNNPDPIDVKTIWQNQSTEGTSMSLEDIRKRIGQLEKRLRNRDVKAGIGALIVMACFIRSLFVYTTLIEEIGSVLTLIGTAYMTYQLLLIRKKPAGAAVAEKGPFASLKFYRDELGRQRDFHCGLWFWSRVVIFLPGPLVFLIGRAVAHPEIAHRVERTAMLFVLIAVIGVPRSLWRARTYQREIDDLDAVKN